MIRRITRVFAFRLAIAALAIGMLLSPSFAQLTAAERCRSACSREGATALPSCCSVQVGKAYADRHSDHGPTNPGSDTETKYCPGCNGRPLIASATPVTLTLDLTPIDRPAIDAVTSVSFDVPFAIFHPPRA